MFSTKYLVIFAKIVRQEVVQVIVQHHVWTYCSVNSSLKRRAWLATVGCEALLTITFQRKHPTWRMVRLADMSNGCEPLHHRYKWLAYGCWQAMPKRQAVKIVSLFFETTRMQHCSGELLPFHSSTNSPRKNEIWTSPRNLEERRTESFPWWLESCRSILQTD